MTTIVGSISPKYAAIISESQLSEDYTYIKMPTTSVKVVTSGSWVISGSGWSRPSDILSYMMKWPVVPPKLVKADAYELSTWIIRRVVPAVIKTLENNKAIDFDKGTALANDAEFLIATHGKAFLIDEGFGVTPIDDYFVSGSGGKIALGALHAQKSLMPDSWVDNHADMSIEAIKAAIQFDLYSSGSIKGYKSYPSGRVVPINAS